LSSSAIAFPAINTMVAIDSKILFHFMMGIYFALPETSTAVF